MKRKLKIIALIFILISLLAVGAFAQNKTIEWDYGGEESPRETYSFGGELQIGDNKVSPLTDAYNIIFSDYYSENVYYEFDVEKSGYYDFETVSDAYYGIYISQDIKDGVAYGDAEYLTFEDEGYKVYLEEGECVVGLIFYFYDWNGLGDIYNSELNIEFIGSEITDLQIADEYLENIILGYHIATEYDEENICSILAEGKLVFDSGKEYEFFEYLDVRYSDDIAPGENVITFVLPNYEKEYAVKIKTVDDYIKDIEVVNIEEATVVKETFMPDIVLQPDEYIEIIITLPDGTEKNDDYIVELNGDNYIWVTYDYIQKDDGKWYFVVSAADKEFICEPCETVTASFEENFGLYWSSVLEYAVGMIGETSWYFTDAFNMFSGLSAGERMEYISIVFSELKEYYTEVYNLTELFVNSVF